MNRVITVGREFGSGGRELGRRLAETLGIAYYDKEIITEIAKRTSLSEQYVRQVTEQRPVMMYPITIGRSFYPIENPLMEQSQSIYREQTQIIREMAEKSDCVIVGRCADYILQEEKPFRIFVYADIESRMKRCREKGDDKKEDLSDKALKQQILGVDKNRRKYYEFYTGQAWGKMLNYDLCINTSQTDIKKLVPSVASMLKCFYEA